LKTEMLMLLDSYRVKSYCESANAEVLPCHDITHRQCVSSTLTLHFSNLHGLEL